MEIVDSLDELKILAISLWKGFSKLRNAARGDCFCSEQDHLEFPVQEASRSRNPKKKIGI